jgi:putative sterol carrier protein
MVDWLPDEDWLQRLMDKLNSDEQYAQIAKNWEGDLAFVVEPGDDLPETAVLYMDLWHGKCRGIEMLSDTESKKPAFELTAPLANYRRILSGELDPMQALLTRKLKVKGNLAYLLRNVPIVLDFVRCAQEVTRG